MMQHRSRWQLYLLILFTVLLFGSLVGLPLAQMGIAPVLAQYTSLPTSTPAPVFGPDVGSLIGFSGVDANGNPISDIVYPGKGTIFVGSTKVVFEVFARQLPAFYVGSQSVIDIPYIRGADVFGFYKGNIVQQFFADPLFVCVRGSGRLLFAAASQRPRVFLPVDAAPSRYKGFLCAYLGQPGTLALVAS